MNTKTTAQSTTQTQTETETQTCVLCGKPMFWNGTTWVHVKEEQKTEQANEKAPS